MPRNPESYGFTDEPVDYESRDDVREFPVGNCNAEVLLSRFIDFKSGEWADFAPELSNLKSGVGIWVPHRLAPVRSILSMVPKRISAFCRLVLSKRVRIIRAPARWAQAMLHSLKMVSVRLAWRISAAFS